MVGQVTNADVLSREEEGGQNAELSSRGATAGAVEQQTAGSGGSEKAEAGSRRRRAPRGGKRVRFAEEGGEQEEKPQGGGGEVEMEGAQQGPDPTSTARPPGSGRTPRVGALRTNKPAARGRTTGKAKR